MLKPLSQCCHNIETMSKIVDARAHENQKNEISALDRYSKKKQKLETLITEETLLFMKFLRNERKTWICC